MRCLLLLLLAAGMLGLASRSDAAMEYHFLYFPERELVATPALYDLPYEEVEFTAADGIRLHGWYLPNERRGQVLLFFHGNAGNISHRLENLRQLHDLGLAVFIFDYRGYGRSQGRASERGTYADARAARAWLGQKGWQPPQLLYFGRSLGAAVAVQLALESPPVGLILETPFPSIAAMGWHHNPLLYLTLGWLLHARYDNFNKIGRVRSPLLVFAAEHDSIVPVPLVRRLFAQARSPKTLYLIPGADHNDTTSVGGAPYWEQWQRFLDQVAGKGGGETPARKNLQK